ncbi:MAG: hypothetical protein ACI92S_002458, partial [Planctomycetaceae bacterium]
FRFLKNDSRRLSPAGETVTLFNYSADISGNSMGLTF